MDARTTRPAASEWLNDGLAQENLMGRAIAVIRAQRGGSAIEAREVLNERARRTRRNIVVLAAEVVYADSVAAVKRPA